MKTGVGIALGVATLGLVAPRTAAAVDGVRVRTPVQWSDTPCMTTIDRSVDPVFQLPYGIPFEDLDMTKHEVADGRRHQFFAWCRDNDPQYILPQWISEADVAATEAAGLIDPDTVPLEQMLDHHPGWTDCFSRINADDERRPISFEAANEGVTWDTTDLPPGAWVVEGYTWDPPLNRWAGRPGVFRIVDDPAPDAIGPAAAILNGEEVVVGGETLTLDGCIEGAPELTFDLLWSQVGSDQWNTVISAEPVRGPTLAIDWLIPEALAGEAVRVRIDTRDANGREYTAYMSQYVIVIPPSPGCDDDCTGGADTTDGDDSGPGATEGSDDPSATGAADSSGGGTSGPS